MGIHRGMGENHRLTGRVVLPGDPRYEQARKNYNLRFDVHPRVIVFCQTPSDVINAVGWAREAGVPIRVRSARHSYEAFSLGEGIVIDVSDMDRVRVDAKNRLAVVETGAMLLPLYEALWEARLTIPAGTCPTVGIAGLTLGGGFGFLARAMGLTCDNLLKVEMVNASGRLITATETHNPDLLWASRGGGGGSFGVATSFTFRLHAIDRVTIYRFDWPWERLGAVLSAWQGWAPFVDDRLSSVLHLRAASTGHVLSMGLFVGPPAELAPLIAPLLAAGIPSRMEIEEVSYMEATRRYAGVAPFTKPRGAHGHMKGSNRFKSTSDFAYAPLGAGAIDTICDFLARAPSKEAIVELDAHGGAVNRVPRAATAYPHREGTLYSLHYISRWKRDSEEDTNIQWVNGFRDAMQPHVSGAAYVNYCDASIADFGRAYYGSNFPRLVEVKTKYDPEDVFHHPQSIPTRSP